LKRQWQILGGHGCEYSIDTQIDLFCALVGLYNFGRDYDEEETFEDMSVLKTMSWKVKVIIILRLFMK
jgi:hypothetical protein